MKKYKNKKKTLKATRYQIQEVFALRHLFRLIASHHYLKDDISQAFLKDKNRFCYLSKTSYFIRIGRGQIT